MTKCKNFIILISISLFIISCSEDAVSPSPSSLPIEGAWNSGEYIYTIDCTGDELTFDEYVSQIIIYAQNDDAQLWVDYQCDNALDEDFTDDNENGEWDEGETFNDENENDEWDSGEEFCNETYINDTYDTNADSLFVYALETFIIPNWNANPSYAQEIIDNNTVITDVQELELDISENLGYVITWDGECIDNNEFQEDACNGISDAEWNGTECILTSEISCESIGNGEWLNEAHGSLIEMSAGEDLDTYTMDNTSSYLDNIFHGKTLTFDGNSIFVAVIFNEPVEAVMQQEHTICVNLNFNK